MLSWSGTPDAWLAQLLKQLSPVQKLTLFRSSHAAADKVLQHASHVKLVLSVRKPNESKAAAARRHHVAMCLASSAQGLHLVTCDEILTVVPQCIHARIGTLELINIQLDAATLAMCGPGQLHTLILKGCSSFQNDGESCLEDKHVQWPRPIILICEDCHSRCLLQAGAVLGKAITNLRLLTAMTTSELEGMAAKYPNVTKLKLDWETCPHGMYLTDENIHCALHDWRHVQRLAVGKVILEQEIPHNNRSWQHLEVRHPTWSGLAYLPLECFQSVAIHGNLCDDPPDPKHPQQIKQALAKLRRCKSVDILGGGGCFGPGMKIQRGLSVTDLSPEETAQALEIVAQSNSQHPALSFKKCRLEDPIWMSALRHLPTGVSTLTFMWNCYFRQNNEEYYWKEFAMPLPSHVRDLAVQVETFQQAVALLTAAAGLQHLTKLWLYMRRAIANSTAPPGWWDQLYQLRNQLRPSLRLHLSDSE